VFKVFVFIILAQKLMLLDRDSFVLPLNSDIKAIATLFLPFISDNLLTRSSLLTNVNKFEL
jgi:hypothetical protein